MLILFILSPDGKFVAYSSLHQGSPKLFMIDVESGTVIGSLPQKNAGNIRWSRDGKSIEVIATGSSIAERPGASGGLAVYNVFPLVETFKVGEFRKK
jgi:Tol biopolymer transport system component